MSTCASSTSSNRSPMSPHDHRAKCVEGRAVHGWIRGIGAGVLKDLDVCITGPEEVALTHRTIWATAVARKNAARFHARG